jgi:hypothetical protein
MNDTTQRRHPSPAPIISCIATIHLKVMFLVPFVLLLYLKGPSRRSNEDPSLRQRQENRPLSLRLATHKSNPQGRMESNREEALRYKPPLTQPSAIAVKLTVSSGHLTLPVGSGPRATSPAPSNSPKNPNPSSRTPRQKPFLRPWRMHLLAPRVRRLRRVRQRRHRMERGPDIARGRRNPRNIDRDGRIRSIRSSRLLLWSG